MNDPQHGNENERGLFLSPRHGRRRRARRRRRRVLVGVLTLVAVVGIGAWLWFRSGGRGTDPGREDAAIADSAPVPAVTADPPSPGLSPLPDTLDVPEMEASDGFIREVAEDLSEGPDWPSWLVGDDLARRFVAAVVRVSGGASPASSLESLAPEGEFRVRESDGRTVIDPVSYRRYDLLTATFTSLDNRRMAWLYRQLHPLFEEAHQELGFAEGTFDDAVARAVQNVLAVEVPDGPFEVVSEEGVYRFRDPALESRSAAAKHLLRMGPENARRVQAKLRELAAVMEILPDDPSASRR